MKKVIALVVVMACAMSMMAEVAIQSTFNGCTLGKSTKSEVIKNMLDAGASINSSQETVVSFVGGNISAEGIEFPVFVVSFIEDTLSNVLFIGDKRKLSAEQLASVKEKYSKLPLSEEDKEDLKEKRDSIALRLGAFLSDVWAYKDNKNSLFVTLNDTMCVFMYSADEYIGRLAERKVRDKIIKTLPNYDEANAVKSVAGCVFGDTRQNVTNKFRSKADNIIDSDSHSVMYSGVSFGGNHFKRGTLYFINDKFVACKFETEFYTWRYEEAKATYDGLCAQYDRKYTNGSHFDEDKDNMFSAYGMLQDDYEGGLMYPIVISIHKGVSQGGDSYYYVSVSYFERRRSAIYDDEI